MSLTLKELQDSSYICTDKVVSDLKNAFSKDFTVDMACRYARIHKDTYYDWLKKSDQFAQEMAVAQDSLMHKSLAVLEDKLDKKEIDAAKFYLSRRDKQRFSERSELTGADGAILTGINVKFIKENGTDDSRDQGNKDTQGTTEQPIKEDNL